MKSAIVKYVKKYGLLTILLASLPTSSFAYDRVLFNAGTGYATSTFGDTQWMNSSNSSNGQGAYKIDCARLGIAEVASTTVSLYTDTGTAVFKLYELISGRVSAESYTVTNTATPYSFTFSPPLWCSGGELILAREKYVTRGVRWSYKGDPAVEQVVGAYAFALNGNGVNLEDKVGRDIAIIAMGTWATSSAPSGGSGTTTYVSVDTDNLNSILVSFGALFFLILVWTLTHLLFKNKMGR